MAYVLVNSEPAVSSQSDTDAFINSHNYPVVCNDYAGTGTSNGVVRIQFQPVSQRPVILVINGVANSASHQQYELLVNEGHYGQQQFAEDIVRWRGIIDSVLPPAPPPRLDAPRIRSDGTFECFLNGQATSLYRIEASTNLVTWTFLTTNLPGGTLYIDGETPAYPMRFYRAVQE